MIDYKYLTEILVPLLQIPSPTGLCDSAMEYLGQAFTNLGYSHARTNKGGIIVEIQAASSIKTRALLAHADTLGARVREIKSNGRLRMVQVGEYSWNSVEGEGCSVIRANGESIRGTIISSNTFYNISGKTNEMARTAGDLEVRLDKMTSSAEETRALGIRIGDYIIFDPRVELSADGFICSRHLDDKAGIACILTALKMMQDAGIEPSHRTIVHISNYEEVGHFSSSCLPADVEQAVIVDVGAIGAGPASDEFHTTICVQDSWGPYHTGLSQHLIQLADDANIPYRIDILSHYGSDGQALWRAGADVQVALFGPGVDAMHCYERTHITALEATTRLLIEYIRQP